MTFEDKRWDEAASAYRRLYDVAPTKTGREDAMTGYVRATVAGGDGAKIAEMAADVCGHDDAGAVALREAKYAWAGQLRAEGRSAEAVKLYKRAGEGGAHEGGLRSRLLRDRIDVRKRRHGQDRSRRVRLLGSGAAGLLAGAGPSSCWATFTSARGTRSRPGRRGRVSPTVIRPPTTALWRRRRRESQN